MTAKEWREASVAALEGKGLFEYCRPSDGTVRMHNDRPASRYFGTFVRVSVCGLIWIEGEFLYYKP